MKVKLYLGDWFYNIGILGFLKILDSNEDAFATINKNYIEFDTEDLKKFSQYYFNYFFNKYNIGQNVKNRTMPLFEYIEKNIDSEDKETKTNIKNNKKRIKDIIKKQLDKIKKIDDNSYNDLKKAYDQIDKEETIDGIRKIQEIIFDVLNQDEINKKITSNLFKSILSNTYFGQPSFLNVSKTSMPYEEQIQLMYRDYISNIVEMDFINKIIQNEIELKEIKQYIEESLENSNLTSDMIKAYSNIIKNYINKGKGIEDIKKYINEKVISSCSMCENEHMMTSNYTEGMFSPLAISSDNFKNFFWNQNAKFPICDICILILFCIPAGITSTLKTIKDNGVYKEKSILTFVNYDTDIKTLQKTNNMLEKKCKYENRNNNPYTELIIDIVEQDKNLSAYQLQNILVVEIDSEYGKFSRMEYFNIKKYVANFFIKYSTKTLNLINDYRYKLQIVDYILKDKDIKSIIEDRLQSELKNNRKSGYNAFLVTKIRLILNLLKKEGNNMSDIKNKKIYALYSLGIEIHEELKRTNEDNKLDSYTYKMLNSIKAGNKKAFMEIVIKLHMMMRRDVSPILIEVLQDTELDFESIGYSFLSGLISNKYERKEEVQENG